MTDKFSPVGIMHTAFKEKIGAPRQSGMLAEAKGVLKLNEDPRFADAIDQLETFSHIWVIFLFDRHADQPWKPRISPPRVEMEKVGVFASRSPHRPNPIGISALKIEKIDREAPGGIEIHCSGVDILDGTPVLDIKPYLPYADCIPDASAGWANGEVLRYEVGFSPGAIATLERQAAIIPDRYRNFLAELLSLDPRPTPQRRTMPLLDPQSEGAIFRFRAPPFDVEWQISGGKILILALLPLKSGPD